MESALKTAHLLLSQRNLPTHPAPTSKIAPFSLQESWQTYDTNYVINSGFKAACIFGGIIVSVSLEAAKGATAIESTFFLSPSLAKAFDSPKRPNLA